jgi:hypothetical protein
MKRGDIQKAIHYDNVICRLEKIIKNGSFEGIASVEIADMMTEVGFNNIKPIIESKIDDLKEAIDKL